jgi:hypothetical protein
MKAQERACPRFGSRIQVDFLSASLYLQEEPRGLLADKPRHMNRSRGIPRALPRLRGIYFWGLKYVK